MRIYLRHFLLGMLIAFVPSMLVFVGTTPKAEVLSSNIQVPVYVPMATATPESTPVATARPDPTPTAEPTSTPTIYSPTEIDGFFEQYSAQYGVSVDLLRKIAVCESGYRATVVNLYYEGMFQFGAPTWKSKRSEMGEDTNPALRNDAQEAVKTAAYSVSKYGTGMWPNCGK